MAASASVAITYVPSDAGSILPGKSKAPKAFQDAGIVDKLQKAGVLSVSEHHALDSPATYSSARFEQGSVRNEDLNVSVCKDVKRTMLQNLSNSSSSSPPPFQLVLGGECCMLPAIMSAFWTHGDSQTPAQRVGLLYIDADTDLASPTSAGSTGNLAGMTTCHLVHGDGALASMQQFSRPNGDPVCDQTNTVFFGTNMSHPGNTREHFAYLFDNDYKLISSSAVAKDPVPRAANAIDWLEHWVDVVVVHLDVDAIDPHMFPLANLPNFTGVSFEQMMAALKVILRSEKVVALVVAEVNPDHDPGLHMIHRISGELAGMLAARDAK